VQSTDDLEKEHKAGDLQMTSYDLLSIDGGAQVPSKILEMQDTFMATRFNPEGKDPFQPEELNVGSHVYVEYDDMTVVAEISKIELNGDKNMYTVQITDDDGIKTPQYTSHEVESYQDMRRSFLWNLYVTPGKLAVIFDRDANAREDCLTQEAVNETNFFVNMLSKVQNSVDQVYTYIKEINGKFETIEVGFKNGKWVDPRTFQASFRVNNYNKELQTLYEKFIDGRSEYLEKIHQKGAKIVKVDQDGNFVEIKTRTDKSTMEILTELEAAAEDAANAAEAC